MTAKNVYSVLIISTSDEMRRSLRLLLDRDCFPASANAKNADYILETTDIAATLNLIQEQAAAERVNILNILAKATETGHTVTFRAEFTSGHRKTRRQRFFSALATAPETRSLHHSDEEVHSKL